MIDSLIIVVGSCRVIYGIKGAQYYLHNPWFWGKMSVILIVAELAIMAFVIVCAATMARFKHF